MDTKRLLRAVVPRSNRRRAGMSGRWKERRLPSVCWKWLRVGDQVEPCNSGKKGPRGMPLSASGSDGLHHLGSRVPLSRLLWIGADPKHPELTQRLGIKGARHACGPARIPVGGGTSEKETSPGDISLGQQPFPPPDQEITINRFRFAWFRALFGHLDLRSRRFPAATGYYLSYCDLDL